MKDLLCKLSTYNLFNYLFPGVVFSLLTPVVTSYSFLQKDLVLGFFVYYFVGLVISRFGSLLLEPFLKLVTLVKFADYKDFVEACKKDEKIEMLSEVNNSYRTMLSAFVLLVLLKFYEKVEAMVPILKGWEHIILIVSLLTLFLVSYVKQTGYVVKRVEANKGPSIIE
jgi:hypothetical protein